MKNKKRSSLLSIYPSEIASRISPASLFAGFFLFLFFSFIFVQWRRTTCYALAISQHRRRAGQWADKLSRRAVYTKHTVGGSRDKIHRRVKIAAAGPLDWPSSALRWKVYDPRTCDEMERALWLCRPRFWLPIDALTSARVPFQIDSGQKPPTPLPLRLVRQDHRW